MSKVFTGASMSLDGYISGPNETGFEHLFKWMGNGDVEVPTANPELTFRLTEENARYVRALTEQTGAFVVGRKLFDFTSGWGGRHPLDKPVVVLTHNVPDGWERVGENFTFVSDGIESAVERARALADGKAVGVNGGTWPASASTHGCSTRSGSSSYRCCSAAGRRSSTGRRMRPSSSRGRCQWRPRTTSRTCATASATPTDIPARGDSGRREPPLRRSRCVRREVEHHAQADDQPLRARDTADRRPRHEVHERRPRRHEEPEQRPESRAECRVDAVAEEPHRDDREAGAESGEEDEEATHRLPTISHAGLLPPEVVSANRHDAAGANEALRLRSHRMEDLDLIRGVRKRKMHVRGAAPAVVGLAPVRDVERHCVLAPG